MKFKITVELEDVLKVNISGKDDKMKWRKLKVKCTANFLQIYDPNDKINSSLEVIDLTNCFLIDDKLKNTIELKELNTQKYVKIEFKKKVFTQWLTELIRYASNYPGNNVDPSESSNDELIDISAFLSKQETAKSTPLHTDIRNSENKIASKNIFQKKTPSTGKRKKITLFGGNLEEIFENSDKSFPDILNKLITFIESKGISIQGIYRESGNSNEVNRLKALINEGKTPDLNHPPFNDIHVLTSTFKSFFRELEHKLIPKNILNTYIASIDDDPWCKVENDLAFLPLANRVFLLKLLNHLACVNKNYSSNQMNNSNLSIVFGPSLVESIGFDMVSPNGLVKLILDNTTSLVDNQMFVNGIIERKLALENTPPKHHIKFNEENKTPINLNKGRKKFITELKSSKLMRKASQTINDSCITEGCSVFNDSKRHLKGSEFKLDPNELLNKLNSHSNASPTFLRQTGDKLNNSIRRSVKSAIAVSPRQSSNNTSGMDDLIYEFTSRLKKS